MTQVTEADKIYVAPDLYLFVHFRKRMRMKMRMKRRKRRADGQREIETFPLRAQALGKKD